MIVQDIMAKSPAVCTPDEGLGAVARMMVEHDCGAIPVVESRDTPRPVGVLTDRDIVVRVLAEGRNPLDATAGDAMTAAAVTVKPDTSLDECARVMAEHQIRRVVVVDATSGAVIGLVSQADLALNAPADTAGEVVKEISEDESLRGSMVGDYSG
jgi:CBS domain-containing protein